MDGSVCKKKWSPVLLCIIFMTYLLLWQLGYIFYSNYLVKGAKYWLQLIGLAYSAFLATDLLGQGSASGFIHCILFTCKYCNPFIYVAQKSRCLRRGLSFTFVWKAVLCALLYIPSTLKELKWEMHRDFSKEKNKTTALALELYIAWNPNV